jgi:two-component system sensor histidine kinase VicK
MLSLVNAMLNMCRIETGTLAIVPEPAYLPDIADQVILELESQSKPKKLEIVKQYAEGMGSTNVDLKLMHAVFQNLLSNAIRYTPEGGRITCSIEKKNFDFLIKVQDNGIGIPKAQQAKIFTKLFRADNAVQKVEEGTGLGLYIIKRILDQAGGKIWFESKENKGTTFFVSLPLEGMKKMEGTKGLS